MSAKQLLKQKTEIARLCLRALIDKADTAWKGADIADLAWRVADRFEYQYELRKAEYERVCENGRSNDISDETNADTEIA